MVKIGGVTIDTSHPLCFAEELEKACIGMKYEYVCNTGFRGEEEVDAFSKRFGIKKANTIEEMADKVDIGFVHSCNWDKHLKLAEPFVKAGTPVFIDKPIIGNLKDANKLREWVKNGAKIYGASAMRYSKEVTEFLAKPVEERGEVVSIFVEGGVNEYDYAIHSMEIASAIAQSLVTSCKFLGSAKDPKGNPCEAYFVEFENGVTATYYCYHNTWCPGQVIVMTTKGPHFMQLDGFVAYNYMLREVYKQMTKGESRLVDVETLINCCLAMVAGKKSRDELNGAKVTLDQLTETDGFDGNAFEDFYAKAQTAKGPMYK